MADASSLYHNIAEVLSLDAASFAQREKLGVELSFETLIEDFVGLRTVCEKLRMFNLASLPQPAIDAINNPLDRVVGVINQIKTFRPGLENSIRIRENLISGFRSHCFSAYEVGSGWLAAIKSLDDNSQVSALEAQIEGLRQLVVEAEKNASTAIDQIRSKGGELEDILQAAREASGISATAEFTDHFNQEALKTREAAAKWLLITGILVVFLIGMACYFWHMAWHEMSVAIAAQLVTTKILVMGLIVTAVIWCGRMYKALMHQSTIHRHRALLLQTLNAFVHAAKDPAIKDAMVHEGARAVFAAGATGFIEGQASEGTDIKILEIAKSVVPGTAH